jgi:hypothetical protein
MPAFLLVAADAACPRMRDNVPECLFKKLQPGKITGFLCLGDIGRPIMHAFRRIATDFKRVAGYTEEEAHLPESLVCTLRCKVTAAPTECASDERVYLLLMLPVWMVSFEPAVSTQEQVVEFVSDLLHLHRGLGHLHFHLEPILDTNSPKILQVFEQEGIIIGMTHGHLVMPAGDKLALEALRRRMGVHVLLTGSTGNPHTHSSHAGLLINPGSITGARVSPLATGSASFALVVLDNGKARI